MKNRRKLPPLNAGSMADIAFLLLIFFLVVTTIAEDKGIPVILPEYYDGEPGPVRARDVLTILVNDKDELLVEKTPTEPEILKEVVIEFVTNPEKATQKPESSQDAIISIQNDVNTSYEAYVKIYSQIHEAYAEMRNNLAQEYYQTNYAQLSVIQKNSVLEVFPLKLSEADPFETQ